MAYGNQWNIALSNIGNTIANMIYRNAEEEKRSKAEFDKWMAEQKQAKWDKLKGEQAAVNLGMDLEQYQNLSALKDVGDLDIWKDYRKQQQTKKEKELEAQKQKEQFNFLKETGVDEQTLQAVEKGIIKPEKAFELLNKEPEKQSEIIYRDGQALEHIFTVDKDGKKITKGYENLYKMTTTKNSGDEKPKKVLSPEGMKDFQRDWQELEKDIANINVYEQTGTMLKKDDYGFDIDASEYKKEVYGKARAYAEKVKNNMPAIASDWYRELYNSQGSNPKPEIYWYNLMKAYNEGQFDVSGTDEKESQEVLALQMLRELFKATYFFDPVQKYGTELSEE